MTTSKPPSARPSGMAAALNAIRNASREPATPADVRNILATGLGRPSHVRALFGDTSLETLVRLGIALDLETATILAAYRTARATAAAANSEIDAVLV